MEAAVSAETDRIKLRRSEGEVCFVTNRFIKSGELILAIESDVNFQDDAIAHVDNIESLYDDLKNMPEEWETQSDTDSLCGLWEDSPEGNCAICGDTRNTEIVLSFGRSEPWIHQNCLPKFLEVLEDLYNNHSSKILSDKL